MLKVIAHRRIDKIEEAYIRSFQKRECLFPGEKGRKFLSYCLTFDAPSCGFYYHFFPLLKKYNVKAVIALPTQYILETTTLSSEIRLSVPPTLLMQEGIFETKVPFPTWQEIREMVASGVVEVAALSHMHCNLTFSFVDLEREVIQPKKILEMQLQREIHSFVYPFGHHSAIVENYVKQHYRYSFTLQSKYHWSWSIKSPMGRFIYS